MLKNPLWLDDVGGWEEGGFPFLGTMVAEKGSEGGGGAGAEVRSDAGLAIAEGEGGAVLEFLSEALKLEPVPNVGLRPKKELLCTMVEAEKVLARALTRRSLREKSGISSSSKSKDGTVLACFLGCW